MTLSAEHQEILAEIRSVHDELRRHIREDHNFMSEAEVKEILDAQTTLLTTMKAQQEIMADVVLGEKRTTYDGEIVREGGIADIVKSYNGKGFKVNIPWGRITAIATTIITAGGAIIVAIIQSSP